MISSLALAAMAQLPSITVDSLLREMTDLRRLSQRSVPEYRLRQWTSYDRASGVDGRQGDPYANADAGQFIRDEAVEGRTERVMADVKGPGALVHIWSANPTGTVRFYFDGETKPRMVASLDDLLRGRHPMFPEPFAYTAAQGTNLYFPIPFQNGFKVTWEAAPKSPPLYFAVGIREYAPGTRVATFTTGDVARAKAGIGRAAKGLEVGPYVTEDETKYERIAPNASLSRRFEMPNGGEIQEFEVRLDLPDDVKLAWTDPSRRHNLLRGLALRMTFDGETTVDVPLGDFFGSAPGIAPFSSLPISVQPDGRLVARWSMPFRRSATIGIQNGNATAVPISVRVKSGARKFDDGTYLFHAGWNSQTRMTQPRYEFNFADVKGEGRYVGSTLQISNPVGAWWGEGDEKVYVDGEAFPSLFGTGTEDYFGYAWSDPAPFSRPYHSQPPTANIGNFGQTMNNRYHIVDDIPFRRSIRFDMEAWHWQDANTTFATTALWYARPGSTLPKPPVKDQLLIRATPLPKPPEGGVEGESLKWSLTGGRSEIQNGFAQTSGFQQFWWREPKVGAKATTTLRVATSGRYDLSGHFCHARDYGRFRVLVNGKPAKEIDFYSENLEWRTVSIGTFDLPAGDLVLSFETLMPNVKAEPKMNLLGVDYLQLMAK